MTLNEFFCRFIKKIKSENDTNNSYKILNLNYLLFFFLLILLFLIFLSALNLFNQKAKKESQNLTSLIQTEEFSNLSSYFWSKINSPYKEVEYVIKKNDSIEKILKKMKISPKDIKTISEKLKIEKLTNIYAGKKLSLVLKKFNDETNTGKWIDTGLWKFSRHPNYFGEILLWIGLYIYTLPSLQGIELLIGLLSPLFIAVLIIFVSGIPLLEKGADKRWGDNPKYQKYKIKICDYSFFA